MLFWPIGGPQSMRLHEGVLKRDIAGRCQRQIQIAPLEEGDCPTAMIAFFDVLIGGLSRNSAFSMRAVNSARCAI